MLKTLYIKREDGDWDLIIAVAQDFHEENPSYFNNLETDLKLEGEETKIVDIDTGHLVEVLTE